MLEFPLNKTLFRVILNFLIFFNIIFGDCMFQPSSRHIINHALFRFCPLFRISYSDFVKTFSHLEVVHLDSDTSRDEPSLHHRNTWQMKLYQGSWQRGVSAGGCRNNTGICKNLTVDLSGVLKKNEGLNLIRFAWRFVCRHFPHKSTTATDPKWHAGGGCVTQPTQCYGTKGIKIVLDLIFSFREFRLKFSHIFSHFCQWCDIVLWVYNF